MVLPCLNRRIRITLKILVIWARSLASFMRSVRRQASVLGLLFAVAGLARAGGDGNSWQGWPQLNQARFEQYYREKALPQVEELLTQFDPLFMVWFDTPVAMSPEVIETTMALVARHQPQALINSRIGGGYGHFESASDLGMMPCVNTSGWLMGSGPWQTHSTVSGTWGYASYKKELHEDPNRSANGHIYSLADIVSKGASCY